MTPTDVRARVAALLSLRGDAEAAHGREDDLHVDVLSAIADGADNPQALAAEALRTRLADFPRWCA